MQIKYLVEYWDDDGSGDVSYQEFTNGLKYSYLDPSKRASYVKRQQRRGARDLISGGKVNLGKVQSSYGQSSYK